jgi:Domain of unknown function (DUF6457)
MNTLEQWASRSCEELGLDPAAMDTQIVLDLARDVAHGVARPAAPLAAYVLGLAVGKGQRATDASARLTGLAASWPKAPGG